MWQNKKESLGHKSELYGRYFTQFGLFISQNVHCLNPRLGARIILLKNATSSELVSLIFPKTGIKQMIVFHLTVRSSTSGAVSTNLIFPKRVIFVLELRLLWLDLARLERTVRLTGVYFHFSCIYPWFATRDDVKNLSWSTSIVFRFLEFLSFEFSARISFEQ